MSEFQSPQEKSPPGESLVSHATRHIRASILNAEHLPGAWLRTEALQERFGISSSPLREALNRLASEGLVDAKDRRGFRVKSVSVEEINDITRMRLLLEAEALKESIRSGDDHWEARVLGAYHRLSLAQGRLAGAEMVVDQNWSGRHREYHIELLSGCTSSKMRDLCANYFVQAERYRHVSAAFRRPSPNASEEHLRLMKAAIARQEKLALRLLCEHIQRATNGVIAALEAHPFQTMSNRRTAKV